MRPLALLLLATTPAWAANHATCSLAKSSILGTHHPVFADELRTLG